MVKNGRVWASIRETQKAIIVCINRDGNSQIPICCMKWPAIFVFCKFLPHYLQMSSITITSILIESKTNVKIGRVRHLHATLNALAHERFGKGPKETQQFAITLSRNGHVFVKDFSEKYLRAYILNRNRTKPTVDAAVQNPLALGWRHQKWRRGTKLDTWTEW